MNSYQTRTITINHIASIPEHSSVGKSYRIKILFNPEVVGLIPILFLRLFSQGNRSSPYPNPSSHPSPRPTPSPQSNQDDYISVPYITKYDNVTTENEVNDCTNLDDQQFWDQVVESSVVAHEA